MSDNPKLKKSGGEGTGLGNFLRSLDLKETLPKALGIGMSIVRGDIGAMQNFINGNDEMTLKHQEHALKLLDIELQEMFEITKRLQTDNEHAITRMVRPVSYCFMFVIFMICIFFDGNVGDFTIAQKYIPVIESIFWIQTTFYFGSRGLEKMMKVFKAK